MHELEAIGREIGRALTNQPEPAQLLSLIRRRSKLVLEHAVDDPGLAAELITENERWIAQSKRIMDDIKSQIEDNRASKNRQTALRSAYDGVSGSHKIFTHRG